VPMQQIATGLMDGRHAGHGQRHVRRIRYSGGMKTGLEYFAFGESFRLSPVVRLELADAER